MQRFSSDPSIYKHDVKENVDFQKTLITRYYLNLKFTDSPFLDVTRTIVPILRNFPISWADDKSAQCSTHWSSIQTQSPWHQPFPFPCSQDNLYLQSI